MNTKEFSQYYFGNVEVSLAVLLKRSCPRDVIELFEWACHRDTYYKRKIDYERHPWAWALHSRAGNFIGFHASRIWKPLRSVHNNYHFTTRFSCNNFQQPVGSLLAYLEKWAEPTGFVGFLRAEGLSYPMLVYITQSGVVLQQVSESDGAIANYSNFSIE